MNDLISVIVPVYNVEKYLDACVKSIINQTYKKLEIILVDDGSTDNSPSMCDEYKKKDDRIKVIHKINGGLSDARNAGLDIATGKYVTFIDSDDIIDCNFVKLLYDKLRESECDICVCRFDRFKKVEDIEKVEYPSSYDVVSSKDYYEKVLYQKDHTLYSSSSCPKLYKSRIFRKNRFLKGKINEDNIILDDVVNEASRICVYDAKMYHYRINEGSITNSTFKIASLYIIEYYKQLLKKYESDDTIKAALITMLYTRSIDILTNMQYSKSNNKIVRNELWHNVTMYRRTVLKNKKPRKSIKISCILSYLIGRNMIIINCQYKRIKKRLNLQ